MVNKWSIRITCKLQVSFLPTCLSRSQNIGHHYQLLTKVSFKDEKNYVLFLFCFKSPVRYTRTTNVERSIYEFILTLSPQRSEVPYRDAINKEAGFCLQIGALLLFFNEKKADGVCWGEGWIKKFPGKALIITCWHLWSWAQVACW